MAKRTDPGPLKMDLKPLTDYAMMATVIVIVALVAVLARDMINPPQASGSPTPVVSAQPSGEEPSAS